MKLKELPTSLFHEFKLRLTPIGRLISPTAEVLPVIVSLTTIESRLSIVDITIRSILCQQQIPEKIILWINVKLKDAIPSSLKKLEEFKFFEIKFNEYNSPHRKLLSTMECFPNRTIVTIDDDIIYSRNWLGNLYQTHIENPQCIVTNTARIIQYDEKGFVLPYAEWKHAQSQKHHLNLPIGYSGTLYPPNSLHEDVLNWDLALKIAPKADDLWYKAMSLRKGTESIVSSRKTKLYPLRATQKNSLRRTNVGEDMNRIQWQQLHDSFNLQEIINQKS